MTVKLDNLFYVRGWEMKRGYKSVHTSGNKTVGYWATDEIVDTSCHIPTLKRTQEEL